MRFTSTSAAILATSLQVAMAQTFTDCNPLEKTCPADPGLKSSTFNTDFTKGNASWSGAAYTTIGYGSNGAEFKIDQNKQAPTVQTDFYFLFGRVDVTMRASPGTGIISSVVLLSDVLDEVDWEFVGGDSAQVQSNFFGKGNTTSYDRVKYIPVSNPQENFHTYTFDWTKDRLQYLIDGNVVRTIQANEALTNYGHNYPQTPMRLKLGSWCGGCDGSPQGTIEWAGGKTTFDGAPFNMYVKSVSIQSYNPADNYVYSDNSGSWQSIKINGGSSSSDNGSKSSDSTTTATTTKPTTTAVVAPISNTAVVAPPTVTGASNSTSSNSTAAQPTGIKTTTAATNATKTTTSTGPAAATGAASTISTLTGASLLSIALAVFML
ncbi:glycoside hydrolase family 16 protein [Dissoconium aciculare CBS 342.82]|jgi:beta-glucanase (GH16 family)|uniref:Crh-like protein n=1 Tax=Dissoconium aciculare CBS 342.82 TaxID=1314786 RepID=A0A6J3MFG3_9PEZI|nr:glycoside hydrolase family 16 protein [Dissoconium aciculare CBS 342.82]KAF1826583.1 glycoside hydrolase family 16 protein [Dissoconium aciculare CBS 342.82]